MSSTPLLAQAADSPAAADAPVIAAPPPPVASVPAVEAAPVIAAAPAAEPAATMRTQSTPIVHTGDDDVATAPAATRRVAAAPARRAQASEAAASTRSVAPAAATKPVVTAERAAPAPAAPAPAATPAPAPAAVQTATTRTSTDNSAEVGALALAGVVVVGGLAYGLSRRRRGEDEAFVEEETAYEPVTATPFDGPVASPLVAPAVPLAAAAPARPAGASRLPNGFDLSRFGPHTQAAYRGPTPDNPSHSLRKRLHRAAFFDQRAREAAAAGLAPAVPAPAVASNAASDDQIVVRVGKPRSGSLFGGQGFATQR